MKFYLDTCIWRDYYENRSDNLRPLGEWALQLINKIIKSEGIIILSTFLIKELRKEYSIEKLKDMLSAMPKKSILNISYSKNQIKEANNISKKRKIFFGDVLHAILARDNDAILVTRDSHFLELLDIVEIRKPEELI
jgi:predicted nucleic acid-binding protein